MEIDWGQFVVEVAAALVGAAVGGVIAYWIARRSINADRKVRDHESAERLADLARAEAIRLRGVRAEAVFGLLGELLENVDNGQPMLPDRPVDLAIARVLADGSEDSYDVWRWVVWKAGSAQDEIPNSVMALVQRYDLIRTMMLAWLRPEDEAGVVASIRAELARHEGTQP